MNYKVVKYKTPSTLATISYVECYCVEDAKLRAWEEYNRESDGIILDHIPNEGVK